MNTLVVPAIWLIVMIVGLPQLSETVYTPSLPDIADELLASESMVEYTLTIYLFGFAIGTLFWGKISDKLGRKPCIIAGLLVFILGCILCYFAQSIEMLMMSRFIQAFGGSIGSVLGQAVCRDAFHGPALGKVYSAIGSALALFPALGPVFGAMIAETFGWRNIFVFLALFGLFLILCVSVKLQETHPIHGRKPSSLFKIAKQLIFDKKVFGFGMIVAGCNGIVFSYFAEGSFYLIKGLGLSQSYYGLSFIFIAIASMLGGVLSKNLHSKFLAIDIMHYGLYMILCVTSIFSIIALVHHNLYNFPNIFMISVVIISQMGCAFGICIATSNALALALVDYKHAIGTASSLFGFFYYCMISLFTFFMGLLHNGTLVPMPLYFLSIGVLMVLVNKMFLKCPRL